jgi:hypothetical protein
VFVNRVLRRIFGPRRDQVTGEWRRLHKECYDLYSTNIIRVIKSRRMRCNMYGGEKEVHTGFWWGSPGGKKPPARLRRRWDYIKLDLQSMGWAKWDWDDLAQDGDRWRARVNAALNHWVP